MEINSFCELPLTRARITCEGWLSFCCYMRPDGNQTNEDVSVGNLLTQSFDEIWFGPEAEAVRQTTVAGDLHHRCQRPGCPFSSQEKPYKAQKVIYSEYPTFLEIDLPNTHCNVGGLSPGPDSPACVMCQRSAPDFKPEEDHLFEVLERVKHVLPSLTHIHVQGVAEPFYESSDFGYLVFDVLDALDFKHYAHHITVSVTTNATVFKKAVREKWLSMAPHSSTTFSVDAASPQTFKRIRIFDCFDQVVKNMSDFCQERNRRNNWCQIHNNINTLNVHEAVDMVRLAHKVGVDRVEFNPTEGFYREIMVNEGNCGRFRRAQLEIVEECERLGMRYSFLRPLDLGMTNHLVQITL